MVRDFILTVDVKSLQVKVQARYISIRAVLVSKILAGPRAEDVCMTETTVGRPDSTERAVARCDCS